MADTKITALDVIGANPINVATFPIPMVDLLDNSMAASGTTKKVTVNQILGAGGTATLASATITGDLTVDTNRLVVNASGVCIGTTTATPFAGNTKAVVGGGSGAIGLTLYGGVANTTGLYYADGIVGNETYRGYLEYSHATDSFAFGTAGVNRYTIDSTGISTWSVGGSTAMTLDANVLAMGVTPAPWATIKALQVGAGASLYGYTSTEATLSGNTYYNAGLKYVGNGQASQYQQQNGEHRWFSAANNTSGAGAVIAFGDAKMTLDASGNLLVGTTSQASGVTLSRATIKSTSADWTSVIWNSNATPYGFRIQHDTDSNGTGNEFLLCLGAANIRASIRSNGGIANYQANDVSLSDSRMKSDIKPLGSYWNKIKSLEIVTFKYKDQTHNDDNIGLIAQQVESVAPEFVDVDGFGNTPADGVPLKTIYTTDLYHAAIKALQEAMTRIEALESKLA